MAELPHEEEVLDLVDINDKVVGKITHDKVFDPKNVHPYFLRAVNAFIINDEGKLWIPRRTAHKKIAPNGLDFSVGEHVMSGESYETAIVRGFEEELHMNVAIQELKEFYISKPSPLGKPPYYNVNYIYLSNAEPHYNEDDFVGAEWLTPQELLDRMRTGEKGKISLIEITEALLRYQLKNASDKNRNK